MLQIGLIVLARVVHVVSGIAWSGGTFVMAGAILPMASRYAKDSFGRWAVAIADRVGPAIGIAALLTVVSGAYLFIALHRTDTSASGLVLRAGALAALLALAAGQVSRRTGQRLRQLNEAQASAGAAPPSPNVPDQMATLNHRAVLSSRVAAVLIGLALLAMAVFRYAPAL